MNNKEKLIISAMVLGAASTYAASRKQIEANDEIEPVSETVIIDETAAAEIVDTSPAIDETISQPEINETIVEDEITEELPEEKEEEDLPVQEEEKLPELDEEIKEELPSTEIVEDEQKPEIDKQPEENLPPEEAEPVKKPVLTGLIDNKYYDESGNLQIDKLVTINNEEYYADGTGELHKLEKVTYANQNQTLIGYVIQSGQNVDISKINADFIVLQATSGYKDVNANFDQLAQSVLNNGKLLAFYHDARMGTKEDAHMEAFHFYQTVKNFVGKGLPILRFVNDPAAGPVWADEFLDTLYGLSGMKGVIWTTSAIVNNSDWSKTEYDVVTNVEKLNITKEEWANRIKTTLPSGTQEMYRMYNPYSGEHLYTMDANERDQLVAIGWRYESLGWTAPASGEAVYRLYNPYSGDHLYTMNASERDSLVKLGWRYEGIGFYSDDKTKYTAVYRLFNPYTTIGTHHFTTNKAEYDELQKVGWIGEGIAWYGMVSTMPRNDFPLDNYIKDDKGYNKNMVNITGVQKVNGALYYFNPSNQGKYDKGTGFISVAGTDRKVFVNADGKLFVGQKPIDGKYKWFDLNSGYMAVNQFVDIPASYNSGTAKTCYYDANGNMVYGTFTVGKVTFTTDQHSGELLGCKINGLPYYNQTDPKWGSILIGNYKISSTGCVMMVATSVINFLNNTNYSPVDIAKECYKAGYYNNGGEGTTSDVWAYISKKYGLQYQNNLSFDNMVKALKEGKVIVGAVGYSRWCPYYGSTHELLLSGYNNGKVTVYDPMHQNQCGEFDLKDIWNVRSTEPGDNLDRGPFYALSK